MSITPVIAAVPARVARSADVSRDARVRYFGAAVRSSDSSAVSAARTTCSGDAVLTSTRVGLLSALAPRGW